MHGIKKEKVRVHKNQGTILGFTILKTKYQMDKA